MSDFPSQLTLKWSYQNRYNFSHCIENHICIDFKPYFLQTILFTNHTFYKPLKKKDKVLKLDFDSLPAAKKTISKTFSSSYSKRPFAMLRSSLVLNNAYESQNPLLKNSIKTKSYVKYIVFIHFMFLNYQSYPS